MWRKRAHLAAHLAGAESGVQLTLSSRFAWGPEDDYVIRISGPGPETANWTFSWDLRFGSILATRSA